MSVSEYFPPCKSEQPSKTKLLWQEVRESCTIGTRLDKQVENFKKCPLPPEFKSTIEGPSKTWKVFKRQHDAIEYSFTKTKGTMVFSYEERVPDSKGRRLYLVTCPSHMWSIHKIRPPDERCTYEVIIDDLPCKLYFDIEFDKSINPNKLGNEVVKIFINLVCLEIKHHFNIDCNFSNVIWLDSTNSKKFSCHLIYNLEGFAFRNNLEVGKFVHHICETIIWSSSQEMKDIDCHINFPKEKVEQLLVNNKDGKITLLCDQGVYSRNRNFRIYLSTKYNKNTPLKISENNLYKNSNILSGKDDEEFFLDSLVSYIEKIKPISFVTFDVRDTREDALNQNVCKNFGIIRSLVKEEHHKNDMLMQGSHSSPFPEIDSFIQSLISSSQTNRGNIRRWTYFPKAELLVYDIIGYRYCENIGRHHRSNNIMIVADVQRGCYYQKCLDPDCRAIDFRSRLYSLPPQVLPSYYFSKFFDSPKEVQEDKLPLSQVFFDCLSAEEEMQMAEIATCLEISSLFTFDNSFTSNSSSCASNE